MTRLNSGHADERNELAVLDFVDGAVFGRYDGAFFKFGFHLIGRAGVRDRFAERSFAVRRIDDVFEDRHDRRRGFAIFVGDGVFVRAGVDRSGGRDALVSGEVVFEHDAAARLNRGIASDIDDVGRRLEERIIVRVGRDEPGIGRGDVTRGVGRQIGDVGVVERDDRIDEFGRSRAADQRRRGRIVRNRDVRKV